MYLHVGNDIVLKTKDIIGIFDMDNTTVSRQGRDFLPKAQNSGTLINATDDLPSSYVVTRNGGGNKVYISSFSSKVLSKRARASKIVL